MKKPLRVMPARRPYPTDPSDEEWEILGPLVPEAKPPGGRPRAHIEAGTILNAIFYDVLGGGWFFSTETRASIMARR